MGRLREIESIVNDTVSHFGHVKIFPRGLPTFADSLLRGTVRFSKRTGNSIALLNPDNTFDFASIPLLRTPVLQMASKPTWVNQDAILSLGPGKELHLVDDVIDNSLVLKNNITKEYTLQDKVLLYAFPLIVSVDIQNGESFTIVKSHYQLANGDIFAYLQTEGLIQSITESNVDKAILLGTSTDPFYKYIYRLELKKKVNRQIFAGSVVYFRAYPAYFSPEIRVPNSLFSSQQMGPFLLDLLSGRLLEGTNFKETFSIRSFSRSGSIITGTPFEYQTVPKNYVVVNRPWAAHYPMFWQLSEGTMRLTPSRVVLKVDANKLYSAGIKCVPPLPANGAAWRISLTTNDDCSIRFIFYPYPPQEFFLTSGSTNNISVQLPVGNPISDVEINILGNSSLTEVKMSDWSPVKDTLESIQYTFVVNATGQATYQSTGLILKPFFMGSEFLTTSWDIGSIHNGGKIWG